MDRRRLVRDAFLAAAACAVLVGISLRTGAGGALRGPTSAAAGCVGMVIVEVGLLRIPELTRRVWERPAVQAVSVVGVVVAGWLAVSGGAAWVLAVLAWGLAAYVALAAVVVLSGRNPLVRIAR